MSPAHPTEKKFEEHIEQYLLNNGYHKESPENYHKDLCLISSELIAFIQTTQTEQWQKLEQQLKTDTVRHLCDRIKKEGSIGIPGRTREKGLQQGTQQGFPSPLGIVDELEKAQV